MRGAKIICFFVLMGALYVMGAVQQADEGSKKLGVFLGKWQAESTSSSGQKQTSSSTCRWSAEGSFLVCEQITSAADAHHSLTIYSYDSKTGKYSYSTVPSPGGKSSSGPIEVNGNVWTYDASIPSVGKTIQFRTIREFIDAKTSNFKFMRSDDDGQHWNTVAEGKMQKIGD